MNIQGIQPLIILTFFAASVTTIVHCLPMMEQVDVSTLKQTGRIKASILGQLGTHINIHVHHTSSCEWGMDNYYK